MNTTIFNRIAFSAMLVGFIYLLALALGSVLASTTMLL